MARQGGLVGVLILLVLWLGLAGTVHSQASKLDRAPPSRPEPTREDGEKTAESSPGKAPSGASEGLEVGQLLRARFDEGVSFSTPDDHFVLRLRLMEQTDFKLFVPTGQDPARSGMYIPRFRVYFEGNAGRSFEYELSLQRSIEGTFDVLDANINYRPSDAFMIQFGRFLVPYSYEWFDHLEQFFITPERGLFPLNFGLSREAGIMAWGKVMEDRLQYAVGGFSGQLEGLADTNTTRDAVGYLNFRPFLNQPESPFRYLNVGGSIALGQQSYIEKPLPMRTSVQSSENDEAARGASFIFLDFEDDVVAHGPRRQGAVHLAWYQRQLSLESEAQVGRFTYDKVYVSTQVPVVGYNVMLGYFVTGEEVTRRTVVRPLRPFDPVTGQYGPGAIELFARYSYLHLGQAIFDANLARREDWSNNARVTDVGLNWYPNEYLKLYLDWQHAMFGSPVLWNVAEGKKSRINDLFWLRAQIFF